MKLKDTKLFPNLSNIHIVCNELTGELVTLRIYDNPACEGRALMMDEVDNIQGVSFTSFSSHVRLTPESEVEVTEAGSLKVGAHEFYFYDCPPQIKL